MLTTTPPASKSYTRRFRLLSVYVVVLRIILSYGWLKLTGLFRSQAWMDRKRSALHRKNAKRVEQMILRLKGLFIKVGQLISILTNFLPEDFRQGLEGLQDQIPDRPLNQIEQRLKAEFQQDLSNLFLQFDSKPVASASLAQVHRAQIPDGRWVAVKIQHVDIEETARLDLKTIRNLMRMVGGILRIRGLDTQYQQLESMILDELDFTKEAAHIEQIAAHFADSHEVQLPVVVPAYSTRRVLTTEFIEEGIKVSDVKKLEAHGIDRESLAQRIVEAYCQMIFADGIYHADPHPGNIFVKPDGSIVFIDFGAVARLSPAMKEGIPQFLIGILRRDADRMKRAIKQMGFVAHEDSDETIERLIDTFYARFLEDVTQADWHLSDLNAQSTMDAKMDMWGDLRKLNISIRELMSTFQVPKDWVLLDRTVLLLLGLCTHLYPALNPMHTIGPYLERTVLGPEGDWKTFAGKALKDIAQSAISIPDELRRLLIKANQGKLEFQIKGLSKTTNLIYALGHQFLFGILALATGGLAYVARLDNDLSLAAYMTGTAGFFVLLMFGSFLKARKWQRKQS